ncbi:MAG TPA: hypothetical protein VMM18_05545 [Gemmatimonadaceae bacterium]|nr:hypothetical protein [Gemmatimonadaceae bacterium]
MKNDADELAAIRRLMTDAQRSIEDDGRHFLLWGLVTIIGLVATWVAIRWRLPAHWLWLTWAGLIAAGSVLALRWARRGRARAAVRSIAGSLVADIWAGVSIGLGILVFAGAASGSIAPAATSGVVAALLGVGAFASSSVYRQLPLRAMALVWWAGAAVMLLWPGMYTILLMAALVLALLVAPAAVLRARARDAARPEPT